MWSNYKIVSLIVAVIIIAIVAAYLVFQNATPEKKPMLTLTSTAFKEGESIPATYTCDAANISPPLSIANIPAGTKSLVLIMDDPDVPKALVPSGMFDHWVLYDIPHDTTSIPEGGVAGNPGLNGAGTSGYTGPCPPGNYAPTRHRYFFKLYALDTTLEFFKQPTKGNVEAALQGHVIESAELMATYERPR